MVHYDDDMCIQRIIYKEYMFLRRIGVPEMNVIYNIKTPDII